MSSTGTTLQAVQAIREFLKEGAAARWELPRIGTASTVQNAITILRASGEIEAIRVEGCTQYIYRLMGCALVRPIDEDMQSVIAIITKAEKITLSMIKQKRKGDTEETTGDIISALVARKAVACETRVKVVKFRTIVERVWMPGSPNFEVLPKVEEKKDPPRPADWWVKAHAAK